LMSFFTRAGAVVAMGSSSCSLVGVGASGLACRGPWRYASAPTVLRTACEAMAGAGTSRPMNW